MKQTRDNHARSGFSLSLSFSLFLSLSLSLSPLFLFCFVFLFWLLNVLSCCFQANPCQHPIVILRDVKYRDMEALLRFMYNGEVSVSNEQLPQVLHTARMLQVKGLADLPSKHYPNKRRTVIITCFYHCPRIVCRGFVSFPQSFGFNSSKIPSFWHLVHSTPLLEIRKNTPTSKITFLGPNSSGYVYVEPISGPTGWKFRQFDTQSIRFLSLRFEKIPRYQKTHFSGSIWTGYVSMVPISGPTGWKIRQFDTWSIRFLCLRFEKIPQHQKTQFWYPIRLDTSTWNPFMVQLVENFVNLIPGSFDSPRFNSKKYFNIKKHISGTQFHWKWSVDSIDNSVNLTIWQRETKRNQPGIQINRYQFHQTLPKTNITGTDCADLNFQTRAIFLLSVESCWSPGDVTAPSRVNKHRLSRPHRRFSASTT